MRKSLALLPVFIVAVMFVALPAQAQYDPGTDWKTNQVQDVTFMTGGCDSNMTADQCFSAGTMVKGTCYENSCAKCVTIGFWSGPLWVVKDSCKPSSEPGACKCSIDSSKPGCTMEGICFYHA